MWNLSYEMIQNLSYEMVSLNIYLTGRSDQFWTTKCDRHIVGTHRSTTIQGFWQAPLFPDIPASSIVLGYPGKPPASQIRRHRLAAIDQELYIKKSYTRSHILGVLDEAHYIRCKKRRIFRHIDQAQNPYKLQICVLDQAIRFFLNLQYRKTNPPLKKHILPLEKHFPPLKKTLSPNI